MNNVNTEPASPALPIRVGAVSEQGLREQNQDSMTGFSSPFGAVYLIADGMGGHRGGAEAARMVAEGFSRHLLAAPATSPMRDAVTLAVRLTNVEILEKGKSGSADLEGMGSTVVIALVRRSENGLELTTAHVGDSRIYLSRDGQLTQLTKDHTQVQWLLDTHAIDEAAARNHPDASVLTRALGHTTDLQVDISDPIPVGDGDAILLCSDGLSGFANGEDINRTIQQNPDPTVCAQQLVQLALDSGSSDNITVQLLRIGDSVPAPPAPAPRKYQTQAEMATVPMPSPAAARPQSKPHSRFTLLITILVLALAGGLFWWIHRHSGGSEDATKKLAASIAVFEKGAQDLDKSATTDKGAVEQDLTELANHFKKPKNTAESKKLQGNLQKLRDRFQDIAEKAQNLEKLGDKKVIDSKAKDKPDTPEKLGYREYFDEKVKGRADTPERSHTIADLNTALEQSNAELQEYTGRLGKDETQKDQLHKDLQDLLKAPKHGAAGTPNHGQPAAGGNGEGGERH